MRLTSISAGFYHSPGARIARLFPVPAGQRASRTSNASSNGEHHNKSNFLGRARLNTHPRPRYLALRRQHRLRRSSHRRRHPFHPRLRHRHAPARQSLGRRSRPTGIEAHILVTHYHWDHIQGIPFFHPFFQQQNRFHFYSFESKYLGPNSLRKVLEAQLASPYFPVDLDLSPQAANSAK